jgi:hypothetical protein
MGLMFAKKLQARFFALPSGRKPVRDWILGLGRDDRVIVGKDIQKVEFGWPNWACDVLRREK